MNTLRIKLVGRRFSSLALALALAACNAHPLPQDVARVSTVDIVKRMRCEAALGITEAKQAAARRGEAERRHVERIVEVSSIGFDIQFVMTEVNSATITELSFQKDYDEKDNFNITLSGGWNDLTNKSTGPDRRSNSRTFRVIDALRDLENIECDTAGANPIYPMTGRTGMDEVVRTYIELEMLTDLDGLRPFGSDSKTEIVTFSDNVAFATTLATGGTVDLAFKSRIGTVKLTKVGFTGSAMRTDVHSAHVVLARNSRDDPDRIAMIGSDIARGQPQPTPLVASVRLVTAKKALAPLGIRDKRLQIFLAQRSLTARNRILFELERRRRIEQDRAVAEEVLGTVIP